MYQTDKNSIQSMSRDAAPEKLQWDYIDVDDDYVLDVTPRDRSEVSKEGLKHIANEELKIREGLRYISEREEMDRQLRQADRARLQNKRRKS